jgi:hypothetical protein
MKYKFFLKIIQNINLIEIYKYIIESDNINKIFFFEKFDLNLNQFIF